uniref:Sidoreflexin n=1 Tax=Rhabditophanes sp. KR3021 TaxID=114890 RepID=A0AC35U3A6_9BILA
MLYQQFFSSDDNGKLKISTITDKIDLSGSRYDPSTFIGRAKHSFGTINPTYLFFSNEYLDECRKTITNYKKGIVDTKMTADELWTRKAHYDSAFHPETGEKAFVLGRMSAQSPCNALIKGAMLTFYKNPYAVFLWHWTNQGHGALLNYCNRSGKAGSGDNQRLMTAFGCATTAGVTTALTLNALVARMSVPPLVNRFVPLLASSIAMSINIPIIRQQEIFEGIAVKDENDKILGKSSIAATSAIGTVCLSRILIAAPYMIASPVLMEYLSKTKLYRNNTWISAPFQCLLTGLILCVSAPVGCSIFPQKASINVTSLEPALQGKLATLSYTSPVVYYNKGL